MPRYRKSDTTVPLLLGWAFSPLNAVRTAQRAYPNRSWGYYIYGTNLYFPV